MIDFNVHGYSFWTTHLGFLKLGSLGFVTTHLSRCLWPSTFSLNMELDVIFKLLFAMFRFSSRIFYRGAPGLTTGCLGDIWCRGTISCLVFWSFFFNILWNDSRFVSWKQPSSMMISYLYNLNFTSQIMITFLQNIQTLPFYIDVAFTLAQIMAWCRQATSCYLCQCWPRSVTRYGVSRPHWLKEHWSGYNGTVPYRYVYYHM